MKFESVNLDLLFETSWEVCNKVGGIYTVLSTKALTLQNLYKDKTIFIGPDVWSESNPSPYFTEVPSILRPWKEKALLPEGVEHSRKANCDSCEIRRHVFPKGLLLW